MAKIRLGFVIGISIITAIIYFAWGSMYAVGVGVWLATGYFGFVSRMLALIERHQLEQEAYTQHDVRVARQDNE